MEDNNFNYMDDYSSQQQWEVVNTYREINSDTPEQLWINAMAYFNWCRLNPIQIKRTIMVGKQSGNQVRVELPVMYTVKALCLHCNILEEYLKDCRNMKDTAPEWYIVASKIMYLIHDQNLTYAALDLFNPVLVGKVLGMDKEEAPSGNIIIEHVQGLPTLSNSENEILEKLEMENRLFTKEKD